MADQGVTGAVTGDILDTAAIDSLRAMKRPGKASLFQRAFEAYRNTAPGLIERMHIAAQSGDLAALAGASHSLKSSSGNVGAARLAEMCRALERLTHAGPVSDADGKVAEISGAYSDAVEALEQICRADGA